MDKKIACLVALEELKQCPMFRGVYDAKNEDEHFMNGVATVMEALAYMVNDNVGDKFTDEFLLNKINSEVEAGL